MTVKISYSLDLYIALVHAIICASAVHLESYGKTSGEFMGKSMWSEEVLDNRHKMLALFCCFHYVWLLSKPQLYFGVMIFPSVVLTAVIILTTCIQLPHVFLYTVLLHHTPEILLSLWRLCVTVSDITAPATSPLLLRRCLTPLLVLASVVVWSATRVYWYTALLGPSHLDKLPENIIVPAIGVHVFLLILAALNMFHFTRILLTCWLFVRGKIVAFREPFYPPHAYSQKVRPHRKSSTSMRNPTEKKDKTA